MDEKKKMKVILVGDCGVGKTTYITKLRLNVFEPRYIPSENLTTRGLIYKNSYHITVWEFPGENFSILPYLDDSQAAIVMFDLTKKSSYENTQEWIVKIRNETRLDLPIVLVGNKLEAKSERKIIYEQIKLPRVMHLLYTEMSVATGENILQPFDLLLKGIIDLPYEDSISDTE